MSHDHAIRVTLPYEDCKHVISQWADRCHDAIVYQHEADGEVSKTHVHIGLGGCEVGIEALKRMWKDAPGKGNEFWSFKPWVRKNKEQWYTTPDTYLVYMAKGALRPVYVKNISNDIVDKSRQSWVEPVKADKPGDHSERVIQQVMKEFDSNDFKTKYRISDMDDEDIGIGVVHQTIRKAVFRKLWGEHKRVPHASFFKIVADSAFLRICERLDRFEEGMTQVLNPS